MNSKFTYRNLCGVLLTTRTHLKTLECQGDCRITDSEELLPFHYEVQYMLVTARGDTIL